MHTAALPPIFNQYGFIRSRNLFCPNTRTQAINHWKILNNNKKITCLHSGYTWHYVVICRTYMASAPNFKVLSSYQYRIYVAQTMKRYEFILYCI